METLMSIKSFSPIRRHALAGLASLALFAIPAVAMAHGPTHGPTVAQAPKFDEDIKVVFERAIPNIPGKSLIALVVSYPPGGKSPSHLHAGSAFIYAQVLSGAI